MTRIDRVHHKGGRMRITAVVLVAHLSGGAMALAGTRTIDFTADAVGQAPKGFLFGHTAKAGAPGKWVVQAEGPNKVLAQTDADSTRSRFPVAVLADTPAADVDLSVRVKPVSGRVDQAAGLVWRYQDEDNYYIVRANALEQNVVLYKVERGKRTDLPLKGAGRTYGKEVEVPAAQWSTLRVVANGPRFEVHFNGNKLYEVEDTTFTGAGKVGVWTKADSVTQFDDLTVVTK
jgi:3-keto-disaccharide hydrolase